MRRTPSLASLCLFAALAGCGDDNAPSSPDLASGNDLTVVVPPDMTVVAPPDLIGLDLTGVDLTVPTPPDLVMSLPDFAGVDFRLPPQADIAGMAPSCMDTVKNGAETDVDCGGGLCPACAVGKACLKATDCATNLCLNLVCQNPMMSKIAFAAGVSYNTGALPLKVVRADLNADGKLDLVTANQGAIGKTSDVSVLLGQGNGTFAAQVKSNVGVSPNSVAAADFNGDKRDDVAVANGGGNGISGAYSTLLANAQGALGAATNTNLTGAPAAVAAGDFDKDGKIDLVTISNGQGKAGTGFVTIGKGDGTFQVPSSFAVGSSPTDVQTGDFNKDGVLDLVVANGGDLSGPAIIALHLGGAMGMFAAGKTIQTGPGTTTVAVADLNNDGNADVVTVATINGASNLVVLLGKGDGTFQMPINKPLKGADPSSLATADFDSDGRLDIALLYRSGTMAVFAGNGDGTTQAELGFAATSNMGGYSLCTGDFNGDKKPDVAATDYFKNVVLVLLNTTM